MSDLKRYGNDVWERLFQVLYACDSTVSDAEVDADLQRAGIDSRPTLSRVQQLIEQSKAREQLARAEQDRLSMLDRLRNVVVPQVENIRDRIEELIQRAFPGDAQVAHYQKLNKASSDEELRTLFEDLTKLAAMKERQDQNERKAE